jgi:outer membrane protein OmpA-like peptidoglycan-associated protein
MKKTLIMLAVALSSLQSAYSQQALVESKTTDNWFIGINGGLNMKTTHNDDRFKNLNPSVGLRFGRNWTPVVGWMITGDLYLNDKTFEFSNASTLKGMNLDFLGTLNLSNWFGGYKGQPRLFEVVAIGGLGWSRIFDSKVNRKNDLVSKIGMDFAFNLGRARAWQIYLEPAINYNLTQVPRVSYNLNNSALELSLGVNYKFGNSNGTHHFVAADLRNQSEIDALNAKINELQSESVAKDKRIAQDIRRIADLEDSLEVAKNVKPTTVINKVVNKVVNNNVLQPTVIFGQGKSTVDAAQMASVAMIAKYMKNHPESTILIKGYASPEGNPELNQKLSEARATSVKNVLVSRYGISADRLTTQGMGATDELFDEVDFNRVATFTDTSK